jgi:hypothetical protein
MGNFKKFSSAYPAALCENTVASNKELLASRLAPWSPVQAVSPSAKSRGIVVSPFLLVVTPPQR